MGHLKEVKAPGLAQESSCVYNSGDLQEADQQSLGWHQEQGGQTVQRIMAADKWDRQES